MKTGREIARGAVELVKPASWGEVYLGGSQEREDKLVRKYMVKINRVQAWARAHDQARVVRRAIHAKTVAGIANAEFRVLPNIPNEFCVGLFEPGKELQATVRFSNGSSLIRSDLNPDVRGMAVRVHVKENEAQDFLLVNAPRCPARDARQFMIAVLAMRSRWKVVRVARLFFGLCTSEGLHLLRALSEGFRLWSALRGSTSHTVRSLATEQFWSQSPIAFDTEAVRFTFEPLQKSEAIESAPAGDDYLHDDLVSRLNNGPVSFQFGVQRFIDKDSTPIENSSVEWLADVVPLAELTIPQQDLLKAERAGMKDCIDALAFNPWHTTEGFRPLGSLNRVRRLVCESSVQYRDARQPVRPPGLLKRAAIRGFRFFFAVLNWFLPWYALPRLLGLANAAAMRLELREKNLYDTSPRTSADVRACPARYLTARDSEGHFNDLRHPEMGSALQRLGRNVPLKDARPDDEPAILKPSPRTISCRLLARCKFEPATTLNLLAAAWIQFQVHDWIAHELPTGDDAWTIPLEPTDRDWPRNPMCIRKSPRGGAISTSEKHQVPTYKNRNTCWWDGSEIYGSSSEITKSLWDEATGKLKIDMNGLLPLNRQTHIRESGFVDNWWLGLDLMHTLFTLEHNAIVDHLRSEYPHWDALKLFDTARLINVAVMAKIHVLEWTPGILATPTVKLGEKANWWGLEGRAIHQLWGRLSKSEIFSGIPGSPLNHYGVPYSLTEEFVAVYRLHSLIPDEIQLFSLRYGTMAEKEMTNLIFDHERDALDGGLRMVDAMYSFGIGHPGALTLHNFPNSLRKLQLPPEQGDDLVDLAAVDIMRDRERGVPRYNQFLKLIHKRQVRSFKELNDECADELNEVYEGRLDRLDLQVGMLAEKLPPGFGFSDTAFRIFLLMAERRLKSDRFFTTDFRPEVYTQAGMEWINTMGMTEVLLRHYPELRGALRGVDNPFAPWSRVGCPRPAAGPVVTRSIQEAPALQPR